MAGAGAAVPAVLGVGSALMGASGANEQAAGMAASSEYNARIKGQQADAAILQSAEDERRFRVQTKQMLGGIRTAVASSGVQMEGSAMDVLESSASNAELDALTIKHQGKMKAWALKAGAQADMMAASNARTAGNYASATSLLKGAGALATLL